MRSVHAVLISFLLLLLGACTTYPYSYPHRDPVKVSVVGLEPLRGEGMEMRYTVHIRVLNPNRAAINFHGVALDMDINGHPFASGVTDGYGSVEGYSDTVVSVPVSVSAFSVIRQTYGLGQMQSLNNMPYILRGKLGGGWFSTTRFIDSGNLNLPGPTTGSR